jgi:hypothetical protein
MSGTPVRDQPTSSGDGARKAASLGDPAHETLRIVAQLLARQAASESLLEQCWASGPERNHDGQSDPATSSG